MSCELIAAGFCENSVGAYIVGPKCGIIRQVNYLFSVFSRVNRIPDMRSVGDIALHPSLRKSKRE